MSAIAAILHTDGRPASASRIDAMTAAMDYRAGDGTGHAVIGECALGHGAFHICAEDQAASQPLQDQQGRFSIVLDGYLANNKELRSDLLARGAALRNKSDAELCLQAFVIWGETCLDHIDGEFAFIVYDAKTHTLFCACDHTGLRQLHYHWDGRTFVAATDVAAVLTALQELPAPNLPYLAEHVANGWFTLDETAWQGVMRLPMAQCLRVSSNGCERREYWQLPTDIAIRYASDGEYTEHYRSLLAECVSASARSAAPIACEVSGGLDSSAVFCVASGMEKEGTLPAPGLHGFTLSAPEGTPADEASYVRAVERQTGRSILPVDLFCPELDWFVKQGRQDKRPPTLPNTVMLRSLAQAGAEKGCRVSLTGQGGDQWLDGLPHHFRQAIQMRDGSSFLHNLRVDWSEMGKRWTVSEAVRQSAAAIFPDSVHATFQRWRAGEQVLATDMRFLRPTMQSQLESRAAAYHEKLFRFKVDDRIKIEKLISPFAHLVYGLMDLQSAKIGIENRHPMLSRKFVTFNATTPEHIRRRGATHKYIHREAMRGILPQEIVNRKDKAHFSQTFVPHFERMEEYCRQREIDPFFRRLVDSDALFGAFCKLSSLRIDQIPVWALWGTFAAAAFSDMLVPE